MNKILKKRFERGFTLVELLIVMAIMAVLTTIVFSSFLSFRDSQALSKDTDNIVSMLRQAREQTLSSKNSSVYGVHFSATSTTLFVGNTYSISTTTNKTFVLNGSDSILTVSLNGGGSDTVFRRLSGETSQNGTVTISSPRLTNTKTITIHKTGLVEVQ